jgi:hypothetical protein
MHDTIDRALFSGQNKVHISEGLDWVSLTLSSLTNNVVFRIAPKNDITWDHSVNSNTGCKHKLSPPHCVQINLTQKYPREIDACITNQFSNNSSNYFSKDQRKGEIIVITEDKNTVSIQYSDYPKLFGNILNIDDKGRIPGVGCDFRSECVPRIQSGKSEILSTKRIIG